MINFFKKSFCLFLIIMLLAPSLALAQGILPDCGNREKECGFSDLLVLVGNLLRWIVMISIPISAGVFAWAGFQLMTTGIADKRSQAKSMMLKVFIGFAFILSAWLIVSTILDAILKPEFRDNIKL